MSEPGPTLSWLHDGPQENWPAKAGELAGMAVAGLPVPVGFVLPCTGNWSSAVRQAAGELLEAGPVIARAALRGEDRPTASMAGIGLSLGSLRTLSDLEGAIRSIDEHRHRPEIVAAVGPPSDTDRVIVQRQIQGRWLLVGALLSSGADYIEAHVGRDDDPLGTGATPSYAGSVARWNDPARSQVAALCRGVRAQRGLDTHGLDVEIVVDQDSRAHLVQVRPIVIDPLAGWPEFEASLAKEGSLPLPEGVLVLDAEHNPAPLSVAHAWVMRRLAAERPSSGEPLVLAGWLYVRTLVRDLSQQTPTPSPPPPNAARDAVQALHHEYIPAARARLVDLQRDLDDADAQDTARALRQAWGAFLAMIDVYLRELVPARRGQTVLAVRPEHPLTLRERSRYADVLPAAWDIASPTLAELGVATDSLPTSVQLPTDEDEAATLLTEWDDHLFALGLAPLRRVYLRAAALLGVGDDVFALDGDELCQCLLGARDVDPERLRRRAQRQREQARLRPPHRIEDGKPVPVPPGRWLRGIGIGERTQGPLTQRRDLADLWARPPRPEQVVALPALTAQAAVGLANLRVAAVCCEHGGTMSHATLMARELGLTALIGCRGCTDVPEGTQVIVDPTVGRLQIVDVDT